MFRRSAPDTWHDVVRAQLSPAIQIAEVFELRDDGSLLETSDLVLITNYGLVVAAVITAEVDNTVTPPAPVTPVAASVWSHSQGRDGLLRRVVFAGEPLEVLGSGRYLVPLDHSFLDELLAVDAAKLLAALASDLPGSRTH